MIRIENRFQLKQVRAECQAETKQEKCRVLICGGTGCLAGGSAKLYEHMKELAAEHENVQVEIGPEIAHIGVHKSGCHGFCEMAGVSGAVCMFVGLFLKNYLTADALFLHQLF